jgi:hypothetical protein
VRTARLMAIAGILAALLWPELTRYRAERRLAYFDALAQLLRQRKGSVSPQDPRMRTLLLSADAVSSYPGDWRPLMTSAALRTAVGDRAGAARRFAAAARLGERPELDVNLASLHGARPVADALWVRAVWLSPRLKRHIPPGESKRLLARLTQMDRLLREGKLEERDFPPLPRF